MKKTLVLIGLIIGIVYKKNREIKQIQDYYSVYDEYGNLNQDNDVAI
ncbi:hypothetical protein VQE80_10130 [Staphylococcus shinii]|nr:hypothetical protein [Staphylococcus shinii]